MQKIFKCKSKIQIYLLFLMMIFNETIHSQSIVPSEILGGCVASYNVMIPRRTNAEQIKSMTNIRDKIYSTAINGIKIPEEELKLQIASKTAVFLRELNQKDTNSVITSSNQIWDIIGFCRKEFAK